MEDIAGDWWVLRGLNCGETPYPGGYDWYPCQHERFIRYIVCCTDAHMQKANRCRFKWIVSRE
jgi:hypothetical protein